MSFDRNDSCPVCALSVNIDPEPAYYGGRIIGVPGNGAAQCQGCNLITHQACMSPSKPSLCASCNRCDGCQLDAGVSGTWVIRGSAEIAPKVGTHSQELLCPSCLFARRRMVA